MKIMKILQFYWNVIKNKNEILLENHEHHENLKTSQENNENH